MARGKYRKPEDVRDYIITIRTTKSEFEKINKFCRIRGRSKSQLLRTFIIQMIDSF